MQLQPAYLLHSRPFRDTSLLLECLTRDYGKINLIARGARSAKSRSRGLLQPFVPLQIGFGGKSDLKTLYQVEIADHIPVFKGRQLFGALYLNELLVRLVQGHDADQELFTIYQKTLDTLRTAGAEFEPVLRNFELALLEALGYGFPLDHDVHSGDPIDENRSYYFIRESGFTAAIDMHASDGFHNDAANRSYPGKVICNMAKRDFSDEQTRIMAKHLLREVLAAYLGERPLKSRQLFPVTRLK